MARVIQALASSIMWVVGLTTIADNVPLEHMGKVWGTVYVAISGGTSIGPLLSGVLLQLAGYNAAWASAFAVLGVDIIFRLLMMENSHQSGKSTFKADDSDAAKALKAT